MLWAARARTPSIWSLEDSLKPFHCAIPAPAETPAKMILLFGSCNISELFLINEITDVPSFKAEITPSVPGVSIKV